MKPRLRFSNFVWRCFLPYPYGRADRRVGYGYTPAEAYKDWKEQQ